MAATHFFICFFLCAAAVHSSTYDSPLVLMISFDGFRWNYLTRTATPNFDKLINTGVKAKWLQDVFITQTFPNHYTLATGLWEESHGIVANRFYDPDSNSYFDYHNSTDVTSAKFWGGEPIWVTSELQGKHAGTFFWVGSEAPIKGIRPTQWRPYSMNYPWDKRVDAVVDWLANNPTGKEKKVNNITLALLYFPQPDHDGHIYGPESEEVTKMIAQCDSIIGYLLDKLLTNNIYDKVNIIITSDHGMASLSQNKRVPILPHMNVSHVDYMYNYGTGAAIWPKQGFVESVYDGLKNIGPHATVWKKEDIPKTFHYTNNDRIPPILIMTQDDWFLVNNTDSPLPMKGDHGYNNSLLDMHPFFIAHGPAFKENYVSEPFSSVNIYELICHIMGLKPAPNNGSLDAVKHILRSSIVKTGTECHYDFTSAKMAGIGFGILLALLVVAVMVVQFQHGRHKISREQSDEDDYSDDTKNLLTKDNMI